MQHLEFPIPDPVRTINLEREISAAINARARARLQIEPPLLEVIVPDEVDPQLVADIVAAHDGLPTAEQVLDAQRASTGLPFTTEEYAAVRAQMQSLRALRQLGRNAFSGLSAIERDRRLYEAVVDATIVLMSILRDES